MTRPNATTTPAPPLACEFVARGSGLAVPAHADASPPEPAPASEHVAELLGQVQRLQDRLEAIEQRETNRRFTRRMAWAMLAVAVAGVCAALGVPFIEHALDGAQTAAEAVAASCPPTASPSEFP